MNTFGKLLADKDFSESWNKYKYGKVEYYDETPFLYIPKKNPLMISVHLNSNYKKNILIYAIKKAANKKVAFIRIISDESLKLKNIMEKTHYTYILKLDKPINQIYSSLKKSTKKYIKKAESNKLEYRIAQSLKEFDTWWYENYCIWIKDKKFIKERYDFIKSTFRKNSKLFLAYYEEKIIAGLLIQFTTDKKAYGWILSSNDNYISNYPNHFIQWKAIEWLKNNDFKYYDFGGAEDSKIFKQGFSGDLSKWYSYDLDFDPFLKKFTWFANKFKEKIIGKF